MVINIYRVVLTVRGNVNDITFFNGFTFMWAGLEEALGIIVACLPTLAPLFKPSRYGSADSGRPLNHPKRQGYREKPSCEFDPTVTIGTASTGNNARAKDVDSFGTPQSRDVERFDEEYEFSLPR